MTKILLVEDDKSLREIYGVRLLAEGYDIVSAGDGEEALAMAIKERPQLIVSDVMMPKISGFDMLDILRSTSETKDIKVIMMTALSSEDQRERGESLGADRYLVKSQVGIEDVVRTVHEVLADSPVAAPAPAPFPPAAGPSAAPQPQSPGLQTPQRPLPTMPAAAPMPSLRPTQPAAMPQPQQPVAPPAMPSQPTPPVAPAPPVAQAASQQTPGYVTAPPQFAPSEPAAQPATPQPSSLPQPTAPFSTNRPAGLGDKIIHPIDRPEPSQNLSNLMAQELSAATPAPQPPATPQQPTAQPAVTPPSNLAFEETPLARPSQPPSGPQAA